MEHENKSRCLDHYNDKYEPLNEFDTNAEIHKTSRRNSFERATLKEVRKSRADIRDEMESISQAKCTKSFARNFHEDFLIAENANHHLSVETVFTNSENNYGKFDQSESDASHEYASRKMNYNIQNGNMHANNFSVCAMQVSEDQERGSPIQNYEMQNNLRTVSRLLYEDIMFADLPLVDLLWYDASLMEGQQLHDYAFALRVSVMEKIHEFQVPERGELELLCLITDGTLTERNQRLISARKRFLVQEFIRKSLQLGAQKMTYPVSTPSPVPQADEGSENSDISLDVHYLPPASNLRELSNLSETVHPSCSNYSSQVSKLIMDPNMPLVSNTKVQVLPENMGAQNTKYATFNNVHSHISGYSGCNKDSSDCAEMDSIIDSSESDLDAAKDPSKNAHVTVDNYRERLLRNEGIYNGSGLDILLNYRVESMTGGLVSDYAFSLKKRILENVHKLRHPFKKRLELLCELTDGTQTEDNQKSICVRMCELVKEACIFRSPRISPNIPNKHRRFENIPPRFQKK